jgi:anaerobic magnesium-protoporphyrin IX monomethyl ester cyclase
MITLVNCVAPHASEGAGIPPPGLLLLAAAVRQTNIPVRLMDLATSGSILPPDPEEFPRWLGEISPVVGFSTMSNMLPYALEAARCLKAVSPRTTILLGGCGAQAAVAEILTRFPFIDFVFQGEAEVSLPLFLTRYPARESWRETPGIAYRDNGHPVVNPPAPRIRNLDDLPMPAYDLVNRSAYRGYIGLVCSRGCPFACSYCEGAFTRGERVTAYSLERVFAEIKLLCNGYGISHFRFLDDTFTAQQERVVQFCRSHEEEGWDFNWGVLSRVDGMESSLMRLMARTNCNTVYFGVESGSDRTLRTIRKRVSSADISKVVPRAAEHFPHVIASFMWGFPFEELSDLEETLLLAAYLRSFGVTVQMHLWAPMPRSPLCKQYQSQLVYDPGVQSDFVVANVARYESLIASHSTIFAPFYHVPHPAFAQKRQMIRDMGFAE